MLTIGQLAAYAGVTQRAVRHYHQIGLLPEPERDASGYRSYDARAVLALIRIRTLAEAGVPLARVEELLEADDEEFAAAVAEIDRRLRAEVRQLQEHRRRIARLAAGDSLALPPDVVDYLERLRAVGLSDRLVEGERDGWILMAARWPDQIPAMIESKVDQLGDPRTLRLYRLLDQLAACEGDPGAERLTELVDLWDELLEESAERGELDAEATGFADEGFVALMDAFAAGSHPVIERLQELLAERGWSGWTLIERAGT